MGFLVSAIPPAARVEQRNGRAYGQRNTPDETFHGFYTSVRRYLKPRLDLAAVACPPPQHPGHRPPAALLARDWADGSKVETLPAWC